MKKIIYKDAQGYHVINPIEGGRLAKSVTSNGHKAIAPEPTRVEYISRHWQSGVVEWAETEEEFIARLADRLVPAGVTPKVVDSVPKERKEREQFIKAHL